MKVIVIGGNPAGMSAASRLVRRGSGIETVVYERTEEVSYGACGLPYFVGGFNPDIGLMRIRTAEEFRAQGIALHLRHEVARVDVRAKAVTVKDLDTGRLFTDDYDRLVVASGASPVVPAVPGRELPGVYILKTLEDGARLKAALDTPETGRVAIIGGGYIGVELAEACLRLGKQVELFEAAPRLLSGFDPEFGQAAAMTLEDHGARTHLQSKVEQISGEERVTGLTANGEAYDADIVVFAAGVRPNTAFLDGTGIERLPNGALVGNGRMETSLPGIYAAGDCSTVLHKLLGKPVYIPLGTNANKQGRFAADAILGEDRPFDNALGTAMLRCVDLELAKTGLTEAEAKAAGFDAKSATVQTKTHARYYPAPRPITIKLCYEAGSHRLLGAQLMGRGESAWRIDLLACAVDRGMRAEELGQLDLGYAPPFASVWDAVQVAANVIK